MYIFNLMIGIQNAGIERAEDNTKKAEQTRAFFRIK